MAAALHLGGGSKRRREDEEKREQAEGGAEEEDRISALPEALRLHILGLLPLKSAIRTGALSARWRELWTRRWPPPSSLDFHLEANDSPRPLLESLERRGRQRLDRFSLSFELGGLDADDFHRCLDYAIACAVEDLHVHFGSQPWSWSGFFKFILPPGDPHLARLSLYGISVGLPASFSARSHTFSVLEVIHLHGVTLSDDKFYNLVAACPLLRTLDLCYCEGLSSVHVPAARAHLRSLTVAKCGGITEVFADKASSLQSFRYSGAYISAYSIPATPELIDLYICFGGPSGRHQPSWEGINWFPRFTEPNACKLRRNWLDALTNLANLTVLTLCSSALRRVSAKGRARSVVRNALLCKLQNLRELQLLMFAMYNDNMDDIYVFLRTCCCPQLERLFVQLPTKGNQYDPTEEASDSEEEEELLEEDGPVEELSEMLSKEEMREDPGSEQVGLGYRAVSKEGLKEDELEEKLPEGKALVENQLVKNWLEEELSVGGQSAEEPVENGFENLMLLKMTNFKGRHNEMQLVSFVLRKSTSLNKLILLTPKDDHPDGSQRDHLNTSHFLETKFLPLEKASPNVQIILGESDDDAIQPLHLETFVEV